MRLAALLLLAIPSASAAAPCLTDREIDAAVGTQVRNGAPFVDTRDVPDRPLCSGLTRAQAIQRIRAAAFPAESAKAANEAAALIARDTPAPAIAPAPAMAPFDDPPAPEAVARAPVHRAAPKRKATPGKAVTHRASPGSAYFSSCRAARAAGAAPLYRGSKGYSAALDRDGDGVACE